MQNVIHGFLFDFLTPGRAGCTHLLRYQSFEVNHYIFSSDALHISAPDS